MYRMCMMVLRQKRFACWLGHGSCFGPGPGSGPSVHVLEAWGDWVSPVGRVATTRTVTPNKECHSKKGEGVGWAMAAVYSFIHLFIYSDGSVYFGWLSHGSDGSVYFGWLNHGSDGSTVPVHSQYSPSTVPVPVQSQYSTSPSAVSYTHLTLPTNREV